MWGDFLLTILCVDTIATKQVWRTSQPKLTKVRQTFQFLIVFSAIKGKECLRQSHLDRITGT